MYKLLLSTIRKFLLIFFGMQLFGCQTTHTHQYISSDNDLESYLQAREEAARNNKTFTPIEPSSRTYERLKNISETQSVSMDAIFQFVSIGTKYQEIENQYKKGLISKSEKDYKLMALKEKMEKSSAASFIKRASSNPPILNSDRFYQLSQCEINQDKDAYHCVDGKESYYGEGRIIEDFFLPIEYEVYKSDQCKLISNDKYTCSNKSGGYTGDGLLTKQHFLPIYK